MKRGMVVVLGALVLATGLMMSASAATVRRAINFGNGNAMILIGGDKQPVGAVLRGLSPTSRPSPTLGASYSTKALRASKSTFYGDSYVLTRFSDTVYVGPTRAWAQVDGISYTAWYGYVPQFYSSRIRLDEAWTFGGICVSVSVPAGAGFSAAGKTATWAGDDLSGQTWSLGHIYSGISATACLFLTSVNHAANGSHYFQIRSTWVSANAKNGVSSL